jgi:hypothetical protein
VAAAKRSVVPLALVAALVQTMLVEKMARMQYLVYCRLTRLHHHLMSLPLIQFHHHLMSLLLLQSRFSLQSSLLV